MLRGIFTAASAMINAARRVDLAAHDLANMQTPGFKPSTQRTSAQFGLGPHVRAGFDGAEAPLGTSLSTGVSGTTFHRFVQGAIVDSPDRPLDLALSGPGYFRIAGPGGKTLLTRDGTFARSTDGFLVNAQGRFVLSASGQRIRLPQTGSPDDPMMAAPRINERGVVFDRDGNVLGRLGIVIADHTQLVQEGDNAWSIPAGAVVRPDDGRTTVVQGSIEASATDLAQEMTDIMVAQQSYRMNASVLKAEDRALEDLNDNVARPAG